MAALPFIIQGVQTGIGMLQKAASNRRRRKAMQKMKYNIAESTREQLDLARTRASRDEVPGADIARSRMESEMAQGLERGETAADTASDVLGLYSKMYGKKQDFSRQMLESGAKYKSQNELELMRSLGLMADAEEKQFYYNKYVPFVSEMGYAGDQAQGGAANIASGLQGAYQTWENDWMMKQWKEIYGDVGGSELLDNTNPEMNNDITGDTEKYGSNYPAY